MASTYFVDVELEPHLNKKIFFVGEPVKGILKFTPDEDMEIKRLGYEVILETRGKLSGSSKTLVAKDLAHGQTVSAGQTYEYPIEFKNDQCETYSGLNAQILIKLVPIVEEIALRSETFGEMLSSFNPFKSDFRTGTTYLEFQPANSYLTATSEKIRLKLSFLWKLSYIFIGLAALLIAWVNFEFSPIYVIVPFTAITVILGTHFALGKIVLGQITARFSSGKEKFVVANLENSQNWRSVKSVFSHVQRVEEVVDKRGTSSETHTEIMFESKQLEANRPGGTLRFEFHIPNEENPSFSRGDLEVYWEIVVIVDTLVGVSYTLKNTFWVTRESNKS